MRYLELGLGTYTIIINIVSKDLNVHCIPKLKIKLLQHQNPNSTDLCFIWIELYQGNQSKKGILLLNIKDCQPKVRESNPTSDQT